MKAYVEGKEQTRSTRMSQRRAVITGIGPITCIGHGRREFLERNSQRKRAASTRITSFDPTVFNVRIAAAKFAIGIAEEYFSAASSETAGSLRAIRRRLGEAGA